MKDHCKILKIGKPIKLLCQKLATEYSGLVKKKEKEEGKGGFFNKKRGRTSEISVCISPSDTIIPTK